MSEARNPTAPKNASDDPSAEGRTPIPRPTVFSASVYERYVRRLKAKKERFSKKFIATLAQGAHLPLREQYVHLARRLFQQRLALSTVKKYLEIFKKFHQDDDDRPEEWPALNYITFLQNSKRDSGPPAYVSVERMNALLSFFEQRQDRLFLFCFYSGLRSFEVVQIKCSDVKQMRYRFPNIMIVLKGGKRTWAPRYHARLNALIATLVDDPRGVYADYLRTGVDFHMWPLTPGALTVKFKRRYLECFREPPPVGFGLHNVRYWWASSARDLQEAQLVLNHATLQTTQRYERPDASLVPFDKLNQEELYRKIFEI